MSEIEINEDNATIELKKPRLLKVRRFFNLKPFRVAGSIWTNSHIWRAATLILVLLVGYLFVDTRGAVGNFNDSDPAVNGYVPPRDFVAILKKLDASVVTIYCDLSQDKGNLGTAWSMDYPDITNGGRSALVTNHHVIEKCIDQGKLSLEDVWGKKFDARLESYDEENDLAIVSSSHKIKPLEIADYHPVLG